MFQNQMDKTVTLTLKLDEVRNVVAFGNRAQMSGAEADTWVSLKQKIAEAVAEASKEEPPVKAVPND